jgi:hypothetical protein
MKGALSAHHLVCVIWDDAHMTLEEYNPTEVARDFHKPSVVNCYGLLVKDDEAGISLVAQEEPDGTHPYRHIIFIPRGMVREVIDFGVPKRKAVRKPRIPAAAQAGPSPEVPTA